MQTSLAPSPPCAETTCARASRRRPPSRGARVARRRRAPRGCFQSRPPRGGRRRRLPASGARVRASGRDAEVGPAGCRAGREATLSIGASGRATTFHSRRRRRAAAAPGPRTTRDEASFWRLTRRDRARREVPARSSRELGRSRFLADEAAHWRGEKPRRARSSRGRPRRDAPRARCPRRSSTWRRRRPCPARAASRAGAEPPRVARRFGAGGAP